MSTATTTNVPKYHLLGNSGLRVFPLCLGTMGWGETWSSSGLKVTEEDMEKIMKLYVERGGNFIDTANAYQFGLSEENLGRVIKKLNLDRNKLIIATKYSLPVEHDSNTIGNHKKNMVQSINASLKRLQLDYVDILYVHYWDFTTPIDQIMRALDDLVKSGKVLHVAVSDTPAWQVARANTISDNRGWSPFTCYQGRYGLLDRSMEQEIIPMCKELNIGVVPWGILGQGKLTGKRTRENKEGTDSQRKVTMTEEDFKIQDAVITVAEQLKTTVSAVATAWALRRPGISSVLIAPRNVEQLQDALDALELKFSDEQLKSLDDATKNSPNIIFPANFIGTSVETCPWLYAMGAGNKYQIVPTKK